jgi:hypothetical protein
MAVLSPSMKRAMRNSPCMAVPSVFSVEADDRMSLRRGNPIGAAGAMLRSWCRLQSRCPGRGVCVPQIWVCNLEMALFAEVPGARTPFLGYA